jgi:hypothetical protein
VHSSPIGLCIIVVLPRCCARQDAEAHWLLHCNEVARAAINEVRGLGCEPRSGRDFCRCWATATAAASVSARSHVSSSASTSSSALCFHGDADAGAVAVDSTQVFEGCGDGPTAASHGVCLATHSPRSLLARVLLAHSVLWMTVGDVPQALDPEVIAWMQRRVQMRRPYVLVRSLTMALSRVVDSSLFRCATAQFGLRRWSKRACDRVRDATSFRLARWWHRLIHYRCGSPCSPVASRLFHS